MNDEELIETLDSYINDVRNVLEEEGDNCEPKYNLYIGSTSRKALFTTLIERDMDIVGIIDNDNGEFLNKFVETFLKEFPDYLEAPASSMFHGDWFGGLFDHSVSVFVAALKSHKAYVDDDYEVLAWPYLFHDLCKCNNYIKSFRNVKDDATGKWSKVSSYKTDPNYMSIPHGSESLSRIHKFIIKYPDITDWIKKGLTEGIEHAIAYHMGLFGVNQDFELQNYQNSCIKHPEVLLMHHADMIASKLYKF